MPLLYHQRMEIPLLAVQTQPAQQRLFRSTMQRGRQCWSALLMLSLLAGCGTSGQSPVQVPASPQTAISAAPAPTVSEAQQESCHPSPLRGAAALLGPFGALTPEQAAKPEAVGARVCWGGGINKIEESESNRDCMTMLYGDPGAEQGWLWPKQASYFIACGPGHYDRKLFQQFMMGTVSGKVMGRAKFIDMTIPVIEIDAIYRLSDCLQGDTAPQCVHGYQQPQKRPH